MNETLIFELIDYVLTTTDAAAIQARIEEYLHAINWAEQEQKWDLVTKLTDTLSSHFIYSRAVDLKIEAQDPERVTTTMKKFWEQGRNCTRRGLFAARQTQQDEVPFLAHLSRLSGYLGEFAVALDYLKQELILVHPDIKWRTFEAIRLLGTDAMTQEDFLVASECWQICLDWFEETDNKQGMAVVLAFMAVNEEKQNNLELYEQFFARSNELRKQLKEGNE